MSEPRPKQAYLDQSMSPLYAPRGIKTRTPPDGFWQIKQHVSSNGGQALSKLGTAPTGVSDWGGNKFSVALEIDVYLPVFDALSILRLTSFSLGSALYAQ
ncbi:hypothetical protein VTH82DRAFT_6931 [Thermothelomyces myriococcoides]